MRLTSWWRNTSVWVWVASAVLAVAYVVFLLVDFANSEVGFDSTYNLFAPYNLANGNGYTTYAMFDDAEPKLFDPRVSTGPTMLMPLTLAFFVATGPAAVLLAKAMVSLSYLALVAGVARVGYLIAGRGGALVAATVPLFFMAESSPASVLGDLLAGTFLVWALASQPRRPFIAATLLGLAVLTKFVALIAVPVFGVWFLARHWSTRRASWARYVGRAALYGVVILAPTILWEVVKLATMGVSGYRDYLVEFVDFVAHASRHRDGIGGHLGDFIGRSTFDPALTVAIGAVIVGLVSWMAVRFARGKSASQLGTVRAQITAVAVANVVLWSTWWIVFNGGFFRQVLPGLIVGLPATAAAIFGLAIALRASGGMRAVALLPTALLVGSIALQYPGKLATYLDTEPVNLAEQLAVARVIEQSDARAVTTVTRRKIFDLELIAGRPIDIVRPSAVNSGDLLVLSTSGSGARDDEPEGGETVAKLAARFCGPEITTVAVYTVCVVEPPEAPSD